MPNRHPEEYSPQYDDFLAHEWQLVRRDFETSHGYPIERDYGYVRERYYSMAKANAAARVRALNAPKEQPAKQRPVIQRSVYHVNRPPNIVYHTEVKPMFKYTAGIFTGLILAVVGLIIAAVYFFVIVPQQVQDAASGIVNPVTITVEENGEAVWSNEVAPHPTRPELGSGSSKEASDTIHHEGIELLKERPEGTGRNR